MITLDIEKVEVGEKDAYVTLRLHNDGDPQIIKMPVALHSVKEWIDTTGASIHLDPKVLGDGAFGSQRSRGFIIAPRED